ncbi:MAG: NAD-dependent protein deacetylase [Polyangiaceae bacterium]|nr:NAD-dependent protein deacetylase [Polyangiaceae bacterium]
MSQTAVLSQLDRAAEAVSNAQALFITAGAGMGVDSGMPDFRGPEGFWRAYPPYRALGLHFEEMANPRWFIKDPALAWGFYGHRMFLYRQTKPHAGFQILKRWAISKPVEAFVFTSNVDCHFQTAGFSRDLLVECHGTLEYLQCTNACGQEVFPSAGITVQVNPETFRAEGDLPKCPRCGSLARPNVLMFGDWQWDGSLTERQEKNMAHWFGEVKKKAAPLVIVEMGAGTGVPTVRMTSERITSLFGGTLIRINIREPNVPAGNIGISLGALAALTAIDERVSA